MMHQSCQDFGAFLKTQVAFVVFKSGDLISDLLEEYAKILLEKIATNSHNTASMPGNFPLPCTSYSYPKNLDITNKKMLHSFQ